MDPATGELTGDLEEVGVFVLWSGTMADLPMRNKLYKNMGWNANNPCDACTIRTQRAANDAGPSPPQGSIVGCDDPATRPFDSRIVCAKHSMYSTACSPLGAFEPVHTQQTRRRYSKPCEARVRVKDDSVDGWEPVRAFASGVVEGDEAAGGSSSKRGREKSTLLSNSQQQARDRLVEIERAKIQAKCRKGSTGKTRVQTMCREVR